MQVFTYPIGLLVHLFGKTKHGISKNKKKNSQPLSCDSLFPAWEVKTPKCLFSAGGGIAGPPCGRRCLCAEMPRTLCLTDDCTPSVLGGCITQAGRQGGCKVPMKGISLDISGALGCEVSELRLLMGTNHCASGPYWAPCPVLYCINFIFNFLWEI